MTLRLAETSWAPWSGLIVGPIAWALHHQVGSNAVYLQCAESDRWLTIGLGAVLALGTIAASALSLASQGKAPAEPRAVEMRRFTAWIGAAGGGLFVFAIILQTLAGFAAPLCSP